MSPIQVSSSFDFHKTDEGLISSMAFQTPSTLDVVATPAGTSSMPHRVDSVHISSTHRRNHYDSSHHRSSPSPIATLSRSPALSVSSLDHSSVSSPAPQTSRRSPPHRTLQSTPAYANSSDNSENHALRPSRTHSISHFSSRTGGHMAHYNYNQSFDHYDSNEPSEHSPYQMHSTVSNTHLTAPSMSHAPADTRGGFPVSYPLPGQSNHIVHTDDAATKLSDRVRRRCFNCCTTDTSTWRRSNLSPGKVLCNKCGLFERTHSRPRPEQFPHKRGPLASSSLGSRTPPSNHLPPISAHVHPLAPYHYNHPSIAPLASVPEPRTQYNSSALPEIQSWINEPSHASAQPPTARRTLVHSSPGRQLTPPISRAQTTGFESRDLASARESHA